MGEILSVIRYALIERKQVKKYVRERCRTEQYMTKGIK